MDERLRIVVRMREGEKMAGMLREHPACASYRVNQHCHPPVIDSIPLQKPLPGWGLTVMTVTSPPFARNSV